MLWNIRAWPCILLSAPGLAQQACLKKIEIKLELLTDVDKLLIVQKGIRDSLIRRSQQQIHERLWHKQGMVKSHILGCILQKLRGDGFEWKTFKFRFDEEFSDKGGKDENSYKRHIP